MTFQERLNKHREISRKSEQLGSAMKYTLHQLSDKSKHQSELLNWHGTQRSIEQDYQKLLASNPDYAQTIAMLYEAFLK